MQAQRAQRLLDCTSLYLTLQPLAAKHRTGAAVRLIFEQAGVVTTLEDEGAKKCVEQVDFNTRPPTPPEIKKFRQSVVYEPGKIVKHYGLADVQPPHQGPFGVKTRSSESVGSVMRTSESSELKQVSLRCAAKGAWSRTNSCAWNLTCLYIEPPLKLCSGQRKSARTFTRRAGASLLGRAMCEAFRCPSRSLLGHSLLEPPWVLSSLTSTPKQRR